MKERVVHLEQLSELKADTERRLDLKNKEIEKLKELIKEKDIEIQDHHMEVEKLKLNHREAENSLKFKLDDIQFQTMDLRWSQDKFASHLKSQNKNYEEIISEMEQNEQKLQNQIKQLKEIIKKINNKNSVQEFIPKSPVKEKSSAKTWKSSKAKSKSKSK